MQYTSAEILFEKFEVVETYKKDAHTSVHLANHILLGKKIILKTLNTKELPDSSILERFKREAKILANLDHPNVIKVLDFGMFKNFFYISFEFFESRNLRKFLQTETPDIEEKRKLTVKLLKALNVAHQNNIIHRDIKPENILVNDNLELKIADFGLALIQNDTVVTHPSSIVGTPGYMSPEQIRGEKLTMQSDLFSAGILIYEIWSGKNPFIGKDVGDTINKILNYNEKELFAGGSEQFPQDIHEMLEHLLKKSASKRTGSAQEALKTLGVEATLYDIQVVELKKPVNKYIIYTVPVLLVLFVMLGLFYLTSNQKEPEGVTGNKSDNTSVLPADSGGSQTAGGEDIAATSEALPKPGKLFIDCTPWADVYINDRRIDTTPLKDYIELRPGDYRLRLSHPDYPDYIRTIRIEEAQLRSFEINFAEIVGYLVVNANPWGEVFINNKSHGTTPLRKAVMLYPGRYNLKITNPTYGSVNERIRVTARDTISFNYNFENPEINN